MDNRTTENTDDCKHMSEEMCCNTMCDQWGEFVDRDFCKKTCPHFAKKNGAI